MNGARLNLLTGNRQPSREGFTLVELLVAAAGFSLLFLVGTTVFVSVQNRQRDTLARQRVVADGRYLLESMARSVRVGIIDYQRYNDLHPGTGPNSPETILVTRDAENVQTCYQMSGQKLQVTNDCTVALPSWVDLNPADVNVTDLKFWISPRSNPFQPTPKINTDCRNLAEFDEANGVCKCETAGGGGAPDVDKCFLDQRCVDNAPNIPRFICQNSIIQPTVTIQITTQARDAFGAPIRTRLQTTITSRVYGS